MLRLSPKEDPSNLVFCLKLPAGTELGNSRKVTTQKNFMQFTLTLKYDVDFLKLCQSGIMYGPYQSQSKRKRNKIFGKSFDIAKHVF
jgi:hypothetical protein